MVKFSEKVDQLFLMHLSKVCEVLFRSYGRFEVGYKEVLIISVLNPVRQRALKKLADLASGKKKVGFKLSNVECITICTEIIMKGYSGDADGTIQPLYDKIHQINTYYESDYLQAFKS